MYVIVGQFDNGNKVYNGFFGQNVRWSGFESPFQVFMFNDYKEAAECSVDVSRQAFVRTLVMQVSDLKRLIKES